MLAAAVGLLVSTASWGFLEAVHVIQIGVYDDLPGNLGYGTRRSGGRSLARAGGPPDRARVVRLPGHGGHVPAEG